MWLTHPHRDIHIVATAAEAQPIPSLMSEAEPRAQPAFSWRQPPPSATASTQSYARKPTTASPAPPTSPSFAPPAPPSSTSVPIVTRRRAGRTNSAKLWVSRRQCAAPSPFVPASGNSGFEQLEQAKLQLARAEEEKRALRAWAALAEERVAHVSGLNTYATTEVAGAQATLATALDEQRNAVEAQLSTQQELHQARSELGEAEERYDFLRQAKGALRDELQRAQAQVAELLAERHALLARGERLAEERRREASGLEQRAAGAEQRGMQLVREVDVLTAAREAVRSALPRSDPTPNPSPLTLTPNPNQVRSALLRSDAALRHAEERLSRGEAQWRGAAQRGDALEGELHRERGERGGATARADAAEARLAAARREVDARRAEAARHGREEANALAEIEQLRTHAGVVRAEADASMARAAFAEERWSAVLRERDAAREEAQRTAERLGELGAAFAASEARAVAAEDRVVDEELRARADAAGLERAIVNAAYFKRPACVEGAHCLTCGVCHVARNSEFAPLELVTRRSPSWALAGCVAPLERGALSHPCGTAHAQRGSDAGGKAYS